MLVHSTFNAVHFPKNTIDPVIQLFAEIRVTNNFLDIIASEGTAAVEDLLKTYSEKIGIEANMLLEHSPENLSETDQQIWEGLVEARRNNDLRVDMKVREQIVNLGTAAVLGRLALLDAIGDRNIAADGDPLAHASAMHAKNLQKDLLAISRSDHSSDLVAMAENGLPEIEPVLRQVLRNEHMLPIVPEDDYSIDINKTRIALRSSLLLLGKPYRHHGRIFRDSVVANALEIIVSEEFRNNILGYADGSSPLPQDNIFPDGVPPMLAEFANSSLFSGQGSINAGANWPSTMLALLSHPDSKLVEALATAEHPDVPLLLEGIATLKARLAAQRPLLSLPIADFPQTAESQAALTRIFLLRDPSNNEKANPLQAVDMICSILSGIEFVQLLASSHERRTRATALGVPDAEMVAFLASAFELKDDDLALSLASESWLTLYETFIGKTDTVKTLINTELDEPRRSTALELMDTLSFSDEDDRLSVSFGSEQSMSVVVHEPDPSRVYLATLRADEPELLSVEVPLELKAAGATAQLHVPLSYPRPCEIVGTIEVVVVNPETGDVEPFSRAQPVVIIWTDDVFAARLAAAGKELARVTYSASIARPNEAASRLQRLRQSEPDYVPAIVVELELLARNRSVETDQAELIERAAALSGDFDGRVLQAIFLLRSGEYAAAAAAFEAAETLGTLSPAQSLVAAVAVRLAALPTTVVPTLAERVLLGELGHGMHASAVEIDRSVVDIDWHVLVFDALVEMIAPPHVVIRFARRMLSEARFNLFDIYQRYRTLGVAYRILEVVAGIDGIAIPKANLAIPVARLLENEGSHQAALDVLTTAGAPGANDFEHVQFLGILNSRLRNTEEAVKWFNKALALKPGDVGVTERLMRVELDAVKTDPLRSRSRLKELLDRLLDRQQRGMLRDPSSKGHRHGFARLLINAERLDDAEVVLRRLHDEDPTDDKIIFDLVRVAELSENPENVIMWYEKLQGAKPAERMQVSYAKALRRVGEFERAMEIFIASAHSSKEMASEYVRTLFYISEFEKAAMEAETYVGLYPESVQLRILAAAANIEIDRNDAAGMHALMATTLRGEQQFSLEIPLFLCAVARKSIGFNRSLACLDPIFERFGVRRIRAEAEDERDPFDRMIGWGNYPDGAGAGYKPAVNGPLVSVVMTSYNVEKYVETAVRSILRQSYRNLEIIIVDDCSTDSTPNILRQLELEDSRVRVVLKTTNDGTYVSKNIGLLQAQGEFIALQDSDDWSHPDRIGMSIAVLLGNPKVVGLTTDWLRMTSSGNIVIKAGGQIAHVCCISLVFRKSAMAAVGFFDSVRIAADLEFIERLTLTHGASAVLRLRWPLLFGRARSDSLTASEEYGITRIGFSEPRQDYHNNSEVFHSAIRGGSSAFMQFPQLERPFPAPSIILP